MIQIDLPRIYFGEYLKNLHTAEDLIDTIVRPEFNDAMQRLEENLNNIQPNEVAYAASITLDLTESSFHKVAALTGDVTSISIANPTEGQEWSVLFVQDGTGSRVVSGWPASVKLSGGAFVITTTASKGSLITFLYDGTTHWEKSRSTNL